jgi:hypothetical protein
MAAGRKSRQHEKSLPNYIWYCWESHKRIQQSSATGTGKLYRLPPPSPTPHTHRKVPLWSHKIFYYFFFSYWGVVWLGLELSARLQLYSDKRSNTKWFRCCFITKGPLEYQIQQGIQCALWLNKQLAGGRVRRHRSCKLFWSYWNKSHKSPSPFTSASPNTLPSCSPKVWNHDESRVWPVENIITR